MHVQGFLGILALNMSTNPKYAQNVCGILSPNRGNPMAKMKFGENPITHVLRLIGSHSDTRYHQMPKQPYGKDTNTTLNKIGDAMWASIVSKYDTLRDAEFEIKPDGYVEVRGIFDNADHNTLYRYYMGGYSLTIDEFNEDPNSMFDKHVEIDLMDSLRLWIAGHEEAAIFRVVDAFIATEMATYYIVGGYLISNKIRNSTRIKLDGVGSCKPVKFYHPASISDGNNYADPSIISIDLRDDGSVTLKVDNDVVCCSLQMLTIDDLRHFDVLYRAGRPILLDSMFDLMTQEMNVDEGRIETLSEIKSLAKVRDISKVKSFLTRHKPLSASWKYDGCAVRIILSKGKLIKAYTKGKQRDVTQLMALVLDKYLNTMAPSQREAFSEVAITGELIMPDNGRAIAAGYLLQNYIEDSIAIKDFGYKLSFIVYDLDATPNTRQDEDVTRIDSLSHTHAMNMVENTFNMPTVRPFLIYNDADVDDYINGKMDDPREGYDTDGIVFRINDYHDFKNKGETKHHPRGAIAFKFEDEWHQVIANLFEAKSGSNGTTKIIASFDPIVIDGKTIEKAVWQPVLSTKDDQVRFDIDRLKPGAMIDVCLRGKVIPQFRIAKRKSVPK